MIKISDGLEIMCCDFCEQEESVVGDVRLAYHRLYWACEACANKVESLDLKARYPELKIIAIWQNVFYTSEGAEIQETYLVSEGEEKVSIHSLIGDRARVTDHYSSFVSNSETWVIEVAVRPGEAVQTETYFV